MRPRWGSKRLTYLSCAAMVLWIVLVSVLIAREPSPGESSPAALADAFTRAMSTNDKSVVERLTANGQPPEIIDGIMGTASCGTEAGAVGRHLVIARRGIECARLPIAEHDGRWYIDPYCFAPAKASRGGSSLEGDVIQARS